MQRLLLSKQTHPVQLLKTVPKWQSQRFPYNSLPSLFDLCTTTGYLVQIHARFVLLGLHQNPNLTSQLIDSYASLGQLGSSEKVLDSVTDPDASLYTSLVRNLLEHGKLEKIISLYEQMLTNAICPDEYAYPFIFKACSDLGRLADGMKVHCHVIKLGFESNDGVGTALVEMYVNFYEMRNAVQAAEGMSERNAGVWNLLVSGFLRNGFPMESFWMLSRMRIEGLAPNSSIVVSLLKACVELNWFNGGCFVHVLVVVGALREDLSVSTALLVMYLKLDRFEMARSVFENIQEKDSVVWNLMITAYARCGFPEDSLELLVRMRKSGVRADMFTALAIISAAAGLKDIGLGKQIHANTVRNGSDYQVSVHNSLIEMYTKCGNLEMAKKIFESLENKTAVSWSSMIKGYTVNDRSIEALSLYEEMKVEGVKLDSVTVINILPACIQLGALGQVKNLHGYSLKHGLILIESVITALLVSYAKCGCIDMAQKLFDDKEFGYRDVVFWNSMISAYAKHGHSSPCFKLYAQMKDLTVRPDEITFVGLLTACVNSGLVKEGWEYFEEMITIYGYKPSQEHYACMVDLLGRTGHLCDALKLIKAMPFKPDSQVWGPFLSACNIHSERKLAEFAANMLIEMEPKNAGNYVMLSNIYAAEGKWNGVAKMRGYLRERGLKKTTGCSWLEINGYRHEFVVADRSHPRSGDIYTMLKLLHLQSRVSDDQGLELAF